MAIYRGPGGPGDATTDATNEATVATTKAAEAASSASSAASSASTASTKATEAAASASSASTSASNAATSATAASNAQTAAESAETGASNAQTAAETAQNLAEEWASYTTGQVDSTDYSSKAWSIGGTGVTDTASRGAAKEWATKAEDSTVDGTDYSAKHYSAKASGFASNASTSASAAATSASNAATSESNATSSASAASTSASNAATSASNAAASYDSFDDRYLGAKASAPTVDNDGDALLTGAIYWNTSDSSLYLWDGSVWNPAAFTATGSVTSFNTRTGAVVLSSSDVTTALGYTPSTVANLNDITDVTITSPSTNQVLKYNGSVWVNDSDTDTGIQYTDLSVSTATAGSPSLAYNNTNGVFTYTPPDLSSFITASSTDTLTNKSGNISQWTNDSGYLTSYTETDPVVGAITGIVKADGAGNISASVAGTDYLAPAAIGVTVQAYDADTAKYDDTTANFTGTLQNGGHTVLTNASDYLDSADIGVNVQAYDADTAKTDTAQTYTASQRGTVTTDNDLSFDQSATNNFSCTPSAGGTLTFTNHTAGQSGYVLLDNSSGYAITAAATTKITATDLTTISTAGVYLISYFDNGTNAYLTVSASYS